MRGSAIHPHTEFPVFQARLKIGHARVDEILFRFMEKEEMSSPGDVANNTDSGLAQSLFVHSGLLPVLFQYTEQAKCHRLLADF